MRKPHYKPTAAELAALETSRMDVGATAHTAASVEVRGMENWTPFAGSADFDLIDELPLITARGRDLERNNPLAAGASQTMRDNIVGHSLRFSAKPDWKRLGWTEDQGREYAEAFEAEFADYAESDACDVEGEGDLLDLSLRMLTGGLVNGNAVAIPKWLDGYDRWRTKFLVVEGDRLKTPPMLEADPRVRGGRRLDANGRVQGYYIQRSHPGDVHWWYGADYSTDEFDFVPARTPWGRKLVIHLADRTRAGQSLGRSMFTPAMKEFNQTGRYTQAELSRALMQSLVGAFIESALDSGDVAKLLHGSGRSTVDMAAAEQSWRSRLAEYRPRLKEGAVIPLPIGARAKGWENGAPSGQFGSFVASVARWISAALGIPYELLAKDFTQTSYSSARAALLEAWRFFQGRRAWLNRQWLRPVLILWAEEAISSGRLPFVTLREFYEQPNAFVRGRWVFAGRGWVDPVKEAQAAQLRMQLGISTLESECAEQGVDWQEQLEQRLHEERYERSRRRDLDLPDAAPAPTAPASDSDDDEKRRAEDIEERLEALERMVRAA